MSPDINLPQNARRSTWPMFVLIYFLFGVVSLVVLVGFYQVRLNRFVRMATEQAVYELKLQRKIIELEFHSIAGDVRFFANHNELIDYIQHHDDARLNSLGREYKHFADSKQVYDQIRLLDYDTGQELARVNLQYTEAVIVPKERLQDKSNRYYVQDCKKLGPKQMYMSPIDLNIEQGLIETPFKPMIRFGKVIYNAQHRPAAILVFNYKADQLLDMIRQASGTELTDFMLVNSDGYWISHPNSDWQWGWQVPGRSDKQFSNLYPQAWEAMTANPTGKVTTDNGVFVFDTIKLDFSALPSIPDPNLPKQPTTEPAEKAGIWHLVGMVPQTDINAQKLSLLQEQGLYWLVWMVLSIIPVWGLSGSILRSRQRTRQLKWQASFDRVTGLPNRAVFLDRLDQVRHHADRYKRIFSLLYVDLDGFKPVNDRLGHDAGDELLREVANRLMECVRRSDTVSRVGGDEFNIILTEISSRENAGLVAEKMLERLSEPYAIGGDIVTISASIGIATYPEDAPNPVDLIGRADKAMFVAKAEGKSSREHAGEGAFRYWDESMVNK